VSHKVRLIQLPIREMLAWGEHAPGYALI